jgi:putative FmdB family regulatory protein
VPLYEYACEDCGERFEKLLPLREATRGAPCPKCGSKSVRKLMSSFASVSSGSSGADACPTCPTGTCDL